MRVFLIAVGLLFALLVVALFTMPGMVTWNEYKGQFIQVVENTTGRSADILGDVDFQILPTPSVRLEQVQVTNRLDAKHEHFLTVENLEAELSWGALLTGQVQMTKLLLQKPKIFFDVLEDGTNAWTSDERQEKGNVLNHVLDSIQLDDVVLENGSVHFYNAVTDQQYDVMGVNATLVSESMKGPFTLNGKASFEENEFDFQLAGGRMTSEENLSLRADIVSDAMNMKTNFAGVLLLGNDVGMQGEITLDLSSFSSMQSITLLKKFDAKKMNAKGFLTLGKDKQAMQVSLTDIVGTVDEKPFTGKLRFSQNKGLFSSNADLQFSHLKFNQSLFEESEKNPLQQLFGAGTHEGDIRISNMNFTDANLSDVALIYQSKDKKTKLENVSGVIGDGVRFSMAGDITPETQSVQLSLEADDTSTVLKNLPLAFVDQKKIQSSEDKEAFSFNSAWKKDINSNALDKIELSIGEHQFTGSLVKKENSISLSLLGDQLNLDRYGMIDFVHEKIEHLNENEMELGFDLNLKSVLIDEKTITEFSLKGSKKDQVFDVENFGATGLWDSDIQFAGKFDTTKQKAPLNVALDLKTTDLQALMKQLPFKINLPKSIKQAALLANLNREKENQDIQIELSGSMLDAEWQLGGTISDLELEENADLTIRVKGKSPHLSLNPLIKNTSLDFLKDNSFDLYTKMQKEKTDVRFTEMKGTMGETDFQGGIRLVGKSVSADMTLERLNVQSYVPFLSAVKNYVDERELEGKLSLKAKQVSYGDQSVKNVHLQSDFNQSRLDVKKIKADYLGALLEGKALLKWDGDYQFDLSLKELDYDRLGAKLPLKGGVMDGELSFEGNEKTFKGKGDIRIKQATLLNADFAKISGSLLEGQTNVQSLLDQAFSNGESQSFLISTPVEFTHETVSFDGFDVAGDFGKLKGKKGLYDLNDQSYELVFDAELVSPSGVPPFEVTRSDQKTSFVSSDLEAFSSKKIRGNFEEMRNSTSGDTVEDILKRLESENSSQGVSE